MEPEETVTYAEAGKILGLSRLTVRRRVEAGLIAAYKLGNTRYAPVRLSKSDVMALYRRMERP